jgi:hypothetical protein
MASIGKSGTLCVAIIMTADPSAEGAFHESLGRSRCNWNGVRPGGGPPLEDLVLRPF